MKTARFWTGTGLLTGLAIAISLALSPPADETSGLIEGTVTYQGRPVRGGTIFLIEDGVGLPSADSATIDENGRYQFNPAWKRPGTGAKTYRIVVVMDSDWFQAHADSRTLTANAEGSWPSARVVRASLEWPEPEGGNRLTDRWRRHRFSNRETTNLTVRLGPEAAWLDVNLED